MAPQPARICTHLNLADGTCIEPPALASRQHALLLQMALMNPHLLHDGVSVASCRCQQHTRWDCNGQLLNGGTMILLYTFFSTEFEQQRQLLPLPHIAPLSLSSVQETQQREQ